MNEDYNRHRSEELRSKERRIAAANRNAAVTRIQLVYFLTALVLLLLRVVSPARR